MKTLRFLRHAKSSWKDTSLSDKDRPLNKRGVKSCKVMARELQELNPFSSVFVSPAKRAVMTIEGLYNEINNPALHYVIDEDLYTFESSALIAWCQQLEDKFEDVLIVGHNPAMTEAYNWITGDHLENIPTCGYVTLDCQIDQWQQLGFKTGTPIHILKPRDFF